MKIKNIIKYTALFALLIIVTFVVILKFSNDSKPVAVNENIQTNYTTDAKLAGVPLKVEIADTPEKEAQGLSGRKALKDNEAMLFVFDHPEAYKFWMKDMNFAIDMIWFDEAKQVIFIEKNATPESFPKLFGPDSKTLYVLEVPAGWSDAHNLKIGDNLE